MIDGWQGAWWLSVPLQDITKSFISCLLLLHGLLAVGVVDFVNLIHLASQFYEDVVIGLCVFIHSRILSMSLIVL